MDVDFWKEKEMGTCVYLDVGVFKHASFFYKNFKSGEIKEEE